MSQISCMSFNILSCDTHNCGFELPAARINHVLQTIKDHDPDLLGVQEACNLSCPEPKGCDGFDWCEPMLKALDEMGYDHSILREQKGFTLPRQNIACGLIIFFKKGRFVLNESGCFNYPDDVNRYYQWVKLTDTKYNKPIVFTNTHFSIDPWMSGKFIPLAGDGFRTAEAYFLLKFWKKHCDENTALFATGDYNCDDNSAAQQLLRTEVFQPSKEIAQKSNKISSVHGGSTATIDFCYVNPTAQTVTEYFPITTAYPSDVDCKWKGYPSDHRAIMTYCNYN